MKRILVIALSVVLAVSAFAACSNDSTSIYVISREDGSGTRSAFAELLGIVDENENDATVGSAEKVTSTSTVITTVAGNKLAIGYISLGSLSDSVKAVSVDGVAPSVENVKNGTYKIARPFNICYKEDTLSELASDFVKFILSKEGQEIISGDYIPVVDNAESFTSDMSSGQISIGGSSSVTPVMQELIEAYQQINTNAQIEINQTDSSSGMNAAMDGTIDIGMASRELKDSEKAELTPVQIALDGIAIVVNPENTVEDLTTDQVKAIYVGDVTTWADATN